MKESNQSLRDGCWRDLEGGHPARHLAPRLFPFMLTVTLLLCAAVVYVKAHYLVDVPAGILTGLLVNAVVDGVSRRRSGQAYPS